MNAIRRAVAIMFTLSVSFCTTSLAQSQSGSICVAPLSKDWPETAGTLGLSCSPNKLSVKIDSQKTVVWPTGKSVLVEGLDLGARHRVVVYCGEKAQQSFNFRFSGFKTKQLCLFLNDLYKTVQLWEPNEAPWCTCKKATPD
jgi:hypothetical protein